MKLIDTHAHIHFDDYADKLDEIFKNAKTAGVSKIISVGTDNQDSAKAVAFAQKHDNVWATIGLHPHEASRGEAALEHLATLVSRPKVVAVGECGLDYYRNLSPRDQQQEVFRSQIELALGAGLPMVFHVRDAFDDFFDIADDYPGLRGVVHSFTSNMANMQKAVDRGFYIALNGIMTFTKDADQLAAARAVPLDRLILETDCPFLAPVPHRGQPNQPAFIAATAKFLAELRSESLEKLSAATTKNAEELFGV